MHSDPTKLSEERHARYRSAVGSLQYFATMTLWALSYPVARLAQFVDCPTVGHEKQLDQILAWLANNVGTDSCCLSGPVVDTTQWRVYTDSDHAGDSRTDTRSHTGV